MKLISVLVLALLVAPTAALADEVSLPDLCKAAAMPMAMDQPTAMPMDEVDAAHRALMAGMDAMNENMTQGMAAKDIDVAFICGMLPHHQGAIDMAKAELQYGDDPWAKQLAKNIVDAQTKEIVEMKDWLGRQRK